MIKDVIFYKQGLTDPPSHVQGRRTCLRLHEKGAIATKCRATASSIHSFWIISSTPSDLVGRTMTVGLSEGPSRGLAATLPARSTRRAASIAGQMRVGGEPLTLRTLHSSSHTFPLSHSTPRTHPQSP